MIEEIDSAQFVRHYFEKALGELGGEPAAFLEAAAAFVRSETDFFSRPDSAALLRRLLSGDQAAGKPAQAAAATPAPVPAAAAAAAAEPKPEPAAPEEQQPQQGGTSDAAAAAAPPAAAAAEGGSAEEEGAPEEPKGLSEYQITIFASRMLGARAEPEVACCSCTARCCSNALI